MAATPFNLESILQVHEKTREHLIPILQDVQRIKGYIDAQDVAVIARELQLSENEIYGVATFYTQFKFTPPGKHHIKVCMGTACHVRGSDLLLDVVETLLGIRPGETTPDGIFSVDRVACLGCCALSPVVTVDDTLYARMTQPKLVDLLESLQERGK